MQNRRAVHRPRDLPKSLCPKSVSLSTGGPVVRRPCWAELKRSDTFFGVE